jgi:hypothetical protein
MIANISSEERVVAEGQAESAERPDQPDDGDAGDVHHQDVQDVVAAAGLGAAVVHLLRTPRPLLDLRTLRVATYRVTALGGSVFRASSPRSRSCCRCSSSPGSAGTPRRRVWW